MNNLAKNFNIDEIKQNISLIDKETELFEFEKKYFAVSGGLLSSALANMKNLKPEERKEAGIFLNKIKNEIQNAINDKKKVLKNKIIEDIMKSGKIDVTAPANSMNYNDSDSGFIHPITSTIQRLKDILNSLGFVIKNGQDIEDDVHNFDYLNTGPLHPARSMHDSIYIDETSLNDDIRNKIFFHSEKFLLRTHTSPQQIRIGKHLISKIENNEEELSIEEIEYHFKFATLGRTYRNDSDATHSPMFHQMEVVSIGRHVYARDLMTIMIVFLKRFFEDDSLQMRIRPSYFPFTTPSWEIDMFHKETGKWVEILGCGMVHPNVLQNMGLGDDHIRGYAFGAGVERLCMLKYGIKDLRPFCTPNTEWLKFQAQKII